MIFFFLLCQCYSCRQCLTHVIFWHMSRFCSSTQFQAWTRSWHLSNKWHMSRSWCVICIYNFWYMSRSWTIHIVYARIAYTKPFFKSCVKRFDITYLERSSVNYPYLLHDLSSIVRLYGHVHWQSLLKYFFDWIESKCLRAETVPSHYGLGYIFFYLSTCN